jgi:transposase-like protein
MKCPNCGRSLKLMCTIGSDQSCSGYIEQLYMCENCDMDWEVQRKNTWFGWKTKIVSIKRKFWG